MGRDTYRAPFTATTIPSDFTVLTNNWSVMTNLWRDVMLTERLTFDVGYRYFHIDTIRQANVAANQFAASELMFGLRFYEPFRNWRR